MAPLPNMNASLSAPDLIVAKATMKTLHHRGVHDAGDVNVGVRGNSSSSTYIPRASWTEAVESPMKLGNRTDVWDPRRFLLEEQARTLGNDRRKHHLMTERHAQYEAIAQTLGAKERENQVDMGTLKESFKVMDAREQAKTDKAKENKRIFKEGLDEQRKDFARRERELRQEEAKEHAEIKVRGMQQLCLEMKDQEEKRAHVTKIAKGYKSVIEAKAQEKIEERRAAAKQVHETIKHLKASDAATDAIKTQALETKQQHMQACTDRYEKTTGKVEQEKQRFHAAREDKHEQQMRQKLDDYYNQREMGRLRQKQAIVQTLNEQTAHAETIRGTVKINKNNEGEAVNAAYKEYIEEEQRKARDRRAMLKQNQIENMALIEQRAQQAQQREHDEGSFRRLSSISTMRPRSSDNVEIMKCVDASRYLHKPLGRARKVVEAPASPQAPQAPQVKVPSGSRSAQLIMQDYHLKARWFDGLSSQQLRAGQAAARQRKKDGAFMRGECD